jgi:hypothetical protein
MSEQPDARGPSIAMRAVMTVVTLTLAYGNAAVALGPPALLKLNLTLPAPDLVRDVFLMTGMFNSYSERNVDFVLTGKRSARGLREDRGRWIRLPLREHFPQRHGITYTQLFAAHHWDVHGLAAQRKAWAVMAAKVRARHNRLHPDRHVQSVRFAATDWPISPQGYRALKSSDASRPRIWFSEANP